jgi:hypothetical protein
MESPAPVPTLRPLSGRASVSALTHVGGESIPCIAGWGEGGALDAIREYAQTIDTVAYKIEDAVSTDPTDRPPSRR